MIVTSTKVISDSDHRMVYLPIDKATEAEGLCRVIKNAWWLVHPSKGLCLWNSQSSIKRPAQLRGSSPLCNQRKEITERLAPGWPFAVIKHIPLAYIPASYSD